MKTVAALFVETGGVYFGLENVDPWDEFADARKYDDSYAVVAHPPCKRWGRYWHGGPSAKERSRKGDDGGCFASALHSVRLNGGVLEHPEGSHAWEWHGLDTPDRAGGWTPAGDIHEGWTCCVEQGHYGHRARKATWLYAVGTDCHALRWGPSNEGTGERIDLGYHTAAARALAKTSGLHAARVAPRRLTATERMATPVEFRDVLIGLARSVL